MNISKRDAFTMTPQQIAAGKKMWRRTSLHGRLARSSYDAEATAPKTWIVYVNGKGERIEAIECELYVVGRQSNAGEAVVMLHGMCPCCGETFIARQDNKSLDVDRVPFRKAPKQIREEYTAYCRQQWGRLPRYDEIIPIVSSPERWKCDYCHSWCVRVQGGIAYDDHRGATKLTVPANVPIVGESPRVEF